MALARRPPTGALAAAVALAVGGCGSSTSASNRYVDQLNSAQRQFADAVASLPGALAPGRVTNSNPSSTRASASAYGDALAAIIARLRAIRPPANVAGLHRQLLEQLSSYGAAVSAAMPSLAAPDRTTRLAARTRLLSAVQAVDAKITRTLNAIDTRLRV
jgi:hypothetical protein